MIAQDDLNTLGYTTGGLDGIFGGRTEEAVRNYQRSRGLGVDGIIGCTTWRSLQEDVVRNRKNKYYDRLKNKLIMIILKIEYKK